MVKRVRTIGVVCLVMIMVGGLALAQRQGRAGQRGPGQRGQAAGQRMRDRTPGQDRPDMRQMMTDRLQERLGVSETEWKVIQPRLQKVMELARQAQSRGRPGPTGAPRGGGEAAGPDRRRPDRQTAGARRPGEAAGPDRRRPDGQTAGPDRRRPDGQTAGPRRPGSGGQSPGAQPRGPRAQADRPLSDVEKAANGLRELLDREGASSDQIKAGLTTLREARKAAERNLAQAREELRQVLAVKQEAMLVLMGLLD